MTAPEGMAARLAAAVEVEWENGNLATDVFERIMTASEATDPAPPACERPHSRRLTSEEMQAGLDFDEPATDPAPEGDREALDAMIRLHTCGMDRERRAPLVAALVAAGFRRADPPAGETLTEAQAAYYAMWQFFLRLPSPTPLSDAVQREAMRLRALIRAVPVTGIDRATEGLSESEREVLTVAIFESLGNEGTIGRQIETAVERILADRLTARDEAVTEATAETLQLRLFDECETAGWDPDKRNTFGEEIAHLHEEVSEAFREWRLHKNTAIRYQEDGKPTGVPVEFADVLIGLFYNAELHGFDLLEAVEIKHRFNLGRSYPDEGRQLHPHRPWQEAATNE